MLVYFYLKDTDINPTEFEAEALTLNEIEKITNVLRGRLIRAARESLEGATAEEREETLDAALRVAGLMNLFDPKNNKVFKQPEGAILLLQTLLRTRKVSGSWVTPACTVDDALAIMGSKRNQIEFNFVMLKFVFWNHEAKRAETESKNDLADGADQSLPSDQSKQK